MAEGYLALDLLYQEHRVSLWERKMERRAWREAHDPFDINDTTFVNLYRLTPDAVMELVEELQPDLEPQRSTGISTERQVLTALRFYAKGCYQDAIGEQYDLAVSQPTTSRCIRRVTEAINNKLLLKWIKFPMSPYERMEAVQKFRQAPQPFDCTLGAIDCTYLHILGPREHEEAYVNHWGDHTLNVQVVCDPELKILNVNARYPGARHDAFVWANSAAKRVMERNFRAGERHTWLIGDDGYGLEPWLMTPLKHEAPRTPRFKYNDALCSARSVIERLFGVLKSEFRCLSSQRKLMYDPTMAGKIFNACSVLHNMRIHNGNDMIIDEDINMQINLETQRRRAAVQQGDVMENEVPLQGRALALRIQAGFINTHFH